MAAEPIGSAYVIIRAITSQLSKDIKDGLDKGARDADTDEAGREIGEDVGESAGDEFETTWNERASEAIHDSADSDDMRRASDRFGDRLGESLGDDTAANFRQRMEESLGRSFDDIDRDDAAGTLGEDIGDEAGDDFDAAWKRNVAHSVETTDDDDDVDRGLTRMVRGISSRIRELFRRETDQGEGLFDLDLDFDPGFNPFRRLNERLRKDRDSFKFDIDPFKTFAGGIQNVFSSIPGINWLTILGLPLLQFALPVLGALIGQAVGIIGFLTTAALGAGVAMIGLAGAVAPAALVLMSAFKVDSPRLDEFNERVDEFTEQWQTIALATQDPLFDGLESALDILQDSKLIDILASYGERIGGIAGDLAEAAATELVGPGLFDVEAILDEGAGVFKTLGASALEMIRPILQIMRAAMPIAQRFADSIKGAATRFSDFIDQRAKSGALATTFETWYDRLAQVGRILWNIGGALWNVLNIGGDAAVPLFDKFEEFTQKWDDWTGDPANKAAITGFFDNAFKVAGELWGLIGDIIGLIVGPLTTAEGGESMVNFIKSIREVWLPAIVGFIGALTNAIGLVAGFAKTVWHWVEDLAGLFDETFGTNLAENLGPNLLQFALGFGAILIVLSKLKLLKPLISAFGFLLSPLINLLKKFALSMKVWGVGFLTNPVTLAIIALVAALTLLYFHVKPFRDFVDLYLIDPIQRLWETIGGVSGIVDWFQGLPELIGRFINAVPDIAATIANWFTELPETVPRMFESIENFLADDPFDQIVALAQEGMQKLADVFDDVPVLGPVMDFLVEALDLIILAFDDFGAALDQLEGVPVLGAIISFFRDLDVSAVTSTIGEKLGEIGSGIADFIGNLPDLFGQMGDLAEQGIQRLADVFENVPVIGPALGFLALALEDFGAALDQIEEVPVLGDIVSFFRDLSVESLWSGIGAAGDALAGLWDTIVGFVTRNLPNLGSILGEVFGRVVNFVFNALKILIPALIGALIGLARLLGPLLISIIQSLPALLVSVAQFLGNFFVGFWETSGLKEAFDKYWPVVRDAVVNWFKELPGNIADLLGAIDWGMIGQTIVDGIIAAGQALGDLGQIIIDFIVENFPKLGTLLGTALGMLFKAGFKLLFKILPTVLKALPKLILAALLALPAKIAAIFALLGPLLLKVITNIPRLLGAAWQFVVNFFTSFFEELGVNIPAVIDSIVQWFKDLPGLLLDALQDLWDAVVGFFLDLWDELVGHSIIPDMIMAIVDWFIRLPGMILDALLAGLGALLDAGLALAQTVWDGIVAGFNALGDAAGYVWDWFVNTVVGVVGTVVGWIADIGETVWGWITTAFDAVTDAVGYVWDWFVGTVLGGIGAAAGLAGSWLATIGTTIWGWITSAFDAITGAVGYVWDWFVDTVLGGIGAAAGLAGSWLATIGSTVWGWITSAFDAVTGAVDYVWDWFVDTVLGGVGAAGALAGSWLATIGTTVWGWITSAFDAVTGAVDYVWDWFVDTALGVVGDAVGWLVDIGSTVWGWITTSFDGLGEAAGYVGKWFVDTVLGVVDAGQLAGSWLATIGTTVWGWITSGFDAITGLTTWFWDWFTGVIGDVGDIPGALVETLKGIGEDVLGWIKDGFGIAVGILGKPFEWFADLFAGGDEVPLMFTEDDISQMVTQAVASFGTALDTAFRAQETGDMMRPSDWTPLIAKFGDLGTEGAAALENAFHAAIDEASAGGEMITADEIAAINDLFQTQMEADLGARSFADAFSQIWSPENASPTAAQIDAVVGQFGQLGSEGAAAVQEAFDAAMAASSPSGEIITQAEFDAIIAVFRGQLSGADVSDAANTFATNAATDTQTALNSAYGTTFALGGGPSPIDKAVLALNSMAMKVTPASFQTGAQTISTSMVGQVSTAITAATGEANTWKAASDNIGTNLGTQIGEKDQLMVAPTNRLVDKILLTLSRVGNEVDGRVINPFILKMVVGINKAATMSVSATNKLADKVLLTLSRIGNETTRVMNPFILHLVDSINRAATSSLAATNSLVDRVLFTMARIGNEVTRVLSPVGPAMSASLTAAGHAGAQGLYNGFRSGMSSFLGYLHGLGSTIRSAVGDLSNALYGAGQQLISGLIAGMRSQLSQVQSVASSIASAAAAAATPRAAPAAVPGAMNLTIQAFSEGGIFDTPTLGVFAEAGREALIPLTNPPRALDLMRTSGLDALVLADASKKSNANANTQNPNITDVAMLRIDHAEIYDKVDVDIIAARIRKAYTSMAGR